jgi:hypothetical protein
VAHTPIVISTGGSITGTLTVNISDFYHPNINLPTIGYGSLILAGSGTFALLGDITVSGDINFSGLGSTGFNAGTHKVTLNGTSGQNVTSGGNQFYDLTVTNTSTAGISFVDRLVTAYLNANSGSVKKLSFSAASSAQPNTITTGFNVSGSAGQILELAPLVASTTWYLNAPTTAGLHHLKVSFSHEVNGKTLTATTSTDAGGNSNWNITP